MDYNNIILELLDRIKTLENKVSELEVKISELKSEDQIMITNEENVKEIEISSGGKYYNLTNYLNSSKKELISLTFNDVENILGFKLPPSIRRHRANWSNTTTLSFPCSWLKVGYKTVEVDMINEKVTFQNDNSINSNLSNDGKYFRFTDYLKKSNKSYIRLSFQEIEDILGFKLPSSAFNHTAFWSNSRSHSLASSWLNAGYKNIKTDLYEKYAEFKKEE